MDEDLSAEFRESFEARSQGFFEKSKRRAKLRDDIGFSLSKSIIKIYASFCEANLYQEMSFRLLTSGETRRSILRTNGFRTRWWNLVHRASVLYLMIKQLITLLFQYAYDIQTLEQARYLKLSEQMVVTTTTTTTITTTTMTNHPEQQHHHYHHAQQQQQQQIETNSREFGQANETHGVGLTRAHAYESSIARWKAGLDFIGAPFMELSFAVECMVVFVVWNALTLYSVTMIYYKFVGPINLSLFRMLLDEDREQHNVSKLIIEELEKLLFSSRCYLAKAIFRCSKERRRAPTGRVSTSKAYSATREKMLQVCPSSLAHLHKETFVSQLFAGHHLIVKLAKRLAINGSLQPANRTPNWLSRISWIYILIYCSFVSVGFPVIPIIFSPYGAKLLFNYTVSTAPMDRVSLIELNLMAYLTLIVAAFGIALLIIVFIDQAYLVYKLRQLTDECVSKNSKILLLLVRQQHMGNLQQKQQQQAEKAVISFEQVAEAIKVALNDDWQSLEMAFEQINENLIGVLLHYRIFVRQFQPLRHLFSFVAVLMTSFYVLYPIYGLPHLSYMDKSSRKLLVAIFWAFVLWYDCATSPICLYHAQCHHLYKHLFRLLAHVDAMQSLGPKEVPIYNSHIVALLRREIDDPELAQSRVSITLLGSPLSYKYLLRMHLTTLILSLYAVSLQETGSFKGGSTDGPSIFGLFI